MKKMKLNYANSGIKTLRLSSALALLSGIVAALIFSSDWLEVLNRGGDVGLNYKAISTSVICFSISFFFSAVALVLATIGENALFQKQKNEIEGDEEY